MLSEGQVQVRDLVMGPGTSYIVNPGFNPFRIAVRSDQSGDRAWNHGGWSGAEWAGVREVPLQITPNVTRAMLEESGAGTIQAEWLGLHQVLAAAFSPVADSGEEVELRWMLGGREYLLLGRPARFDPDLELMPAGVSVTLALFRALDPLIYDADGDSEVFGLPSFEGGLSVPLTVPFTVDGVTVDGEAVLVNEGTAETGLVLRIDGPVGSPRVTLQRSDGVIQTVRFDVDLPAGQWLEVDTKARTVFLNGLPNASRRGQTTGTWPLLPPGTSTIQFRAADENDTAQLTVNFRSAWW